MRAKEFIIESDLTDFRGYRMSFHISSSRPQILVRALDDWNKELGRVLFNIGDNNELDPQDLEVNEKYQSRGVAKAMYDFVKTKGYSIHKSSDQTDAGAGFWKKHRGEETVWEDDLDEMALPADWDPAALGHDKTFKSRLEYALQRAPRLGGGSSRVAFVIPDQGRETVLKIAKNSKGLAQNDAEVDILEDGYLSKLGILIPIIDYDKTNRIPVWLQTEKANKVSQAKLARMLHASGRFPMTNFIYAVHNVIGDRKNYMPTLNQIKQEMLDTGSDSKDIEIFMEYVDDVADLVNSSSLLPGDLNRASNWGEYQGKPVIIDAGFTENVFNMYYMYRRK